MMLSKLDWFGTLFPRIPIPIQVITFILYILIYSGSSGCLELYFELSYCYLVFGLLGGQPTVNEVVTFAKNVVFVSFT